MDNILEVSGLNKRYGDFAFANYLILERIVYAYLAVCFLS